MTHLAEKLHAIPFNAAQAAVERNYAAIRADSSSLLESLDEQIEAVLSRPGSEKAVFQRLRRIADKLAGAIEPHTACRRGCAHCCHIAVALSEMEAKIIGSEIGRPPGSIAAPRSYDGGLREDFVMRHFGTPCPFLSNGSCSIYASRPLACRLHFNLADEPFFCQTSIPPEESWVPNLDSTPFWLALAAVTQASAHGDIRDFWPGNALLAVPRATPGRGGRHSRRR